MLFRGLLCWFCHEGGSKCVFFYCVRVGNATALRISNTSSWGERIWKSFTHQKSVVESLNEWSLTEFFPPLMCLINRIYVNSPKNWLVTMASLTPEPCRWIDSKKCWLMASQPIALAFLSLSLWRTFTTSHNCIYQCCWNTLSCHICSKLNSILRVKSQIRVNHIWTTHLTDIPLLS